MSGAAGHVTAPKPTSAGRCGPKLQLAWQRVVARPTHCLDLELICGVPGLQVPTVISLSFLGRKLTNRALSVSLIFVISFIMVEITFISVLSVS
jgi:hypothetical protein